MVVAVAVPKLAVELASRELVVAAEAERIVVVEEPVAEVEHIALVAVDVVLLTVVGRQAAGQ